MLKAAIEKIQELVKPVLHEIDGHTFCIGTDKDAPSGHNEHWPGRLS